MVIVALLLVGLEGEVPDFNRDVRPLLSDRCFACHGPDAAARKAGLRLDLRAEAVASGALVPGDVEASEILQRIVHDNPDELMPPPELNKGLNAAEVDILRRWIASGACVRLPLGVGTSSCCAVAHRARLRSPHRCFSARGDDVCGADAQPEGSTRAATPSIAP